MSHAEDRGTGLGDVFDIVLRASSERLFSVVLQLRDSAEDVIVQALCLIVLQRGEQALEKLQMLRDNPLAKHLAESGRASGGELGDFGARCGRFGERSAECLSSLARIFKVLSEQRLCEVSLRNLAYRRALSSDCFKTSSCGSLEYHQFVEEAKAVCGPQCAATSADLKSECASEPNVTLKEIQDESWSVRSPLQESPSEASYPSHLEISIPPTVSFQGGERAPEASGSSAPRPSVLLSGHEAESEQSPSPEPEYKSSDSSLFRADKDSKTDETLKLLRSNESPNQPSTETSTLPSPQNISLPKIPVLKNPHGPDEEEEEIFYTFVILHAPEDEELAERMKEKLEAVVGEGATFSDGFAIPGKSKLKCVEDAVENSAFTFLLLTTNFNTKMLEVETNMALINSIHNEHKFNTVIPLLPEDNCMPRKSIPTVLQTLMPLDLKKSFQRKLQKALSPAKIQTQRRIWANEQAVKRLNRLRQEAANLSLYPEKHLLSSRMVLDHGGANSLQWSPPPNIHIENAKYIMIGNDSTMTVDLGANANKDGSI
ncbi:TIR domain-containing adapter molecule 1 [Nematolebias whitei]|uniref:TIR domain-containing adapter molecule 1 n=1 Tax=Nematolebias whitei TaxID=451745 RepID=UPI001898927A|nr:TIR domain-containing adapter molecule 1 [Nematolebias whitei]XP_037538212.1 TIR domain-containing adapter molecule 1 [Nematolebias whitei]